MNHTSYSPHIEVSKKAGWKAVNSSKDDSIYPKIYSLTSAGEPIGLAEYGAHIAAGEHTHVICIFDSDNSRFAQVEEKSIVPESEFHEFVLDERPG